MRSTQQAHPARRAPPSPPAGRTHVEGILVANHTDRWTSRRRIVSDDHNRTTGEIYHQ